MNGIGGLDWQVTLWVTSGLTVLGGVGAAKLCSDGPFGTTPAVFDPAQIRAIVAERRFRLATAGYFGHMWELYAMWSWIAAFYRDVFSSVQATSLTAFAVIGAWGAREGR